MFAALSRVRPRREGPIWVRRVDAVSAAPPQVAYAVGRAAGNAVTRNRLRRQLRAVVQHHVGLLRPGSAYLVGVTRTSGGSSFEELSTAFSRCVGASHG